MTAHSLGHSCVFIRPPQKRSRQSLNRLNLLYFCVAICGSFQRMDDTYYVLFHSESLKEMAKKLKVYHEWVQL